MLNTGAEAAKLWCTEYISMAADAACDDEGRDNSGEYDHSTIGASPDVPPPWKLT